MAETDAPIPSALETIPSLAAMMAWELWSVTFFSIEAIDFER